MTRSAIERVTDEPAFLERVMGTHKGVREAPEQRSFLAQTFTDSPGHVLPYRMLVPPARPAHAEARVHGVGRERMPLVLLLHGVGERGKDNSAQLNNGVAELLGSDTAAARFPCLYVVPQCPAKHRWVEVDWDAEHHVLPHEPSLPLSVTVELLDILLHRHSIDPQRLYLIGLSMGGLASGTY
jgi:predicted peptidase